MTICSFLQQRYIAFVYLSQILGQGHWSKVLILECTFYPQIQDVDQAHLTKTHCITNLCTIITAPSGLWPLESLAPVILGVRRLWKS